MWIPVNMTDKGLIDIDVALTAHGWHRSECSLNAYANKNNNITRCINWRYTIDRLEKVIILVPSTGFLQFYVVHTM